MDDPSYSVMATMVLTLLATTLAGADGISSEGLPWRSNCPIVSVEKRVYRTHPRPGSAALAQFAYVGPRLELMELQAVESAGRDDVLDDQDARWSTDNGRTWSPLVPYQPSSNVIYTGVTVWEGGCTKLYDPASGGLLEMWLRQIAHGGIYSNATYWRPSRDLGRTWTVPKQLKYEAGPDFNPDDPLNPAYLAANQAYTGNNIARLRNGNLVHCVAHANAVGDPLNAKRCWKMGSVLFIGKWDACRHEYTWEPGAHVEIRPETSARGLIEPEVAELRDGRLLVVWRGSTQGWDGSVATTPGRKFYAISKDGGHTLTDPREWKYDDHTSFYSPSSYHRMIRHSVSGKLYWLGNITATPPAGNSPRYPLIIAEVDERRAALRKNTVTLIDDRQPAQSADVQFSNFSLLENRETHALELWLTAYGETPGDSYAANAYRYTLTLR